MGVVTIYVWIFYKERRFIQRGRWLILVMALGNLAVSVVEVLVCWVRLYVWNGFRLRWPCLHVRFSTIGGLEVGLPRIASLVTAAVQMLE